MASAKKKGKKKSEFTYSSVDEAALKNEKFPELEDPNYPEKLIEELKEKAKEKEKLQKSGHANLADALQRKAHYQYRAPAYAHKHAGRELFAEYPLDRLLSGCDPTKQKAMLEKVSKLAEVRPVWAIIQDRAKWQACFAFPEPGEYPGPEKRFALSKKKTHKTKAEVYFYYTVTQPYKWAAHHLIPIEMFGGTGEVYFDDEEQELIRASGYDVNNGHNCVPVPTSEVAPHCLLAHIGSHPNYSKDAKKELTSVKDLVKEARESGEPHAAFYPQILSELTKAEKRLLKKLKELGTDSVRLFLQGKRPKTDLVKFISKNRRQSTGTRKPYPLGALG